MTTREFLLSAWGWHPAVIVACVAALLAHAKTARFRWRSPSRYFIAAVVIFYLTLASPISALAAGYLFSAHMLQHLLLLLVVPALVLLGLPESNNRRAFRLPPFIAWLAGLSAMWVWHERTLCDAAATMATVRTIQTISFIVLGLMFWSPIASPNMDRRLPTLLGVAYLFSACVGCTILGILITFAPAGAVCPVYLHPVDRLGILQLIRGRWGMNPAVDQKVGGLLMWVPACGIYVSGIMALLLRWYRSSETTAAGSEPAPAFSASRASRGNA
jgi:putative membrane protein